MGSGSYSTELRSTRAISDGYYTKSSTEIFSQRSINNAMSPYGINVRESCDSEEHPNTVPIIVALDVTGSMGSIPHDLVKNGLPTMMDTILKHNIKDPQVLFLAIGDHEYDSTPLQVGQFESSDELLDSWLTKVYIEGGGGGNDGESYLLAWYFGANHTKIDSFEKRNKKGFLFTIGDEPTLKSIPSNTIKNIMGIEQSGKIDADDVLKKVMEKYHVFHLHIKETRSGSRQYVIDGWKQLMSDGLIVVNNKSDIPTIIAETVVKYSTNKSSIVESKINEQSNEILL